jgi:phosphonate transport system permease protein
MTRPSIPVKPADWVRRIGTAVVVVLVLWSLLGLDIKWERLIDLPADLWRVAVLMFGQMPFDETGTLITALWESVSIAWLGTMIAAIFAIPLSFLAAENLVGRPIAWSMRQVFNVLRAVPEVILAIALIPIFGLTPMAGVLAIGIGSIGTLGKLFYEIAEGIQPGPIEAVDATGANRLQRLRWGVLPQLLPEYASFVLYRFEVNIRASAVMGLIGAGGIGNDVAQALRFKEFGTAGLGLLIIIVGTIAIDYLSGMVRKRIINGPGATGGSRMAAPAPITA